jgi:predicted acetyltransferase
MKIDKTVEYKIKQAQIGDKVIIRNLLQLYLYDMTEFEDRDRPLNKSGQYSYRYLDHYWAEKGRHPYLFIVGKEIAGFALVRKVKNHYSVAEFFVLRKFRRGGLGLRWATEIIQEHPGEWKIDFLNKNEIAEKFWGEVASKVAGDNIEEGKLNNIANYLRFSVKG